jgi:hypothetical protein
MLKYKTTLNTFLREVNTYCDENKYRFATKTQNHICLKCRKDGDTV